MKHKNILLAFGLSASLALAAVPSTMIFQGAVTQGGIAVSGSKTVSVAFYDAATAGTQVWANSFTKVQFTSNGYFGIDLSTATTALPAFDKPLFAEVVVDGKAADSRIALSTAPYAQRAAVADSAVNAKYAVSAGSAQAANTLVAGYQVESAKKADEATNAVNATNVVGGYVSSVNGIQGAVKVTGEVNTTVSQNGNTLTIVGPTRVANADLAVNATNATNAVNATNATNVVGGYVSSVNGIQGALNIAVGRGVYIGTDQNGRSITLSANDVLRARNADYATEALLAHKIEVFTVETLPSCSDAGNGWIVIHSWIGNRMDVCVNGVWKQIDFVN